MQQHKQQIPKPENVQEWSDFGESAIFQTLLDGLGGDWLVEGPIYEGNGFGWTAERLNGNGESTLWVALSTDAIEGPVPETLEWTATCGEDHPPSKAHRRKVVLVYGLIALVACGIGLAVWRISGDSWVIPDGIGPQAKRAFAALAAATLASIPMVMFLPPIIFQYLPGAREEHPESQELMELRHRLAPLLKSILDAALAES